MFILVFLSCCSLFLCWFVLSRVSFTVVDVNLFPPQCPPQIMAYDSLHVKSSLLYSCLFISLLLAYELICLAR